MSLPAIIALSDDDEEEATDPTGWEARKSFRCTCREPCYTMFLKGGTKEAERLKHRMQFTSMHKMDQDHAIFDHLRCQAVAQGHLGFRASGSAQHHKEKLSISHTSCNVPVCRTAYESLMGIGRNRHIRRWGTVKDGQPSPPMDIRYLKGNHSGVTSSIRTEIFPSCKICMTRLQKCCQRLAMRTLMRRLSCPILLCLVLTLGSIS